MKGKKNILKRHSEGTLLNIQSKEEKEVNSDSTVSC